MRATTWVANKNDLEPSLRHMPPCLGEMDGSDYQSILTLSDLELTRVKLERVETRALRSE